MDYPYHQEQESENQVERYISAWHQQEKSAERIGAVILLFAGVLSLVLERFNSDVEYLTMALAVAVGLISGAITLLLRSRRPREERRSLHFLRAENQSRNGNFAAFGAVILGLQADGRPMMLISAGLLAIFAGWLYWRAYKIRGYEAFFAPVIEEENE